MEPYPASILVVPAVNDLAAVDIRDTARRDGRCGPGWRGRARAGQSLPMARSARCQRSSYRECLELSGAYRGCRYSRIPIRPKRRV